LLVKGRYIVRRSVGPPAPHVFVTATGWEALRDCNPVPPAGHEPVTKENPVHSTTRRIFALLFSGALLFGTAACGDDSDDGTVTETETEEATETETLEETETETMEPTETETEVETEVVETETETDVETETEFTDSEEEEE
jgi:hypothetical protein